MPKLGLEKHVVDEGVYRNSLERFRRDGIVLPTFAQLADPALIPEAVLARLAEVDPEAPDPLNLFRVHWYNTAGRPHPAPLPDHLVLPPALTGVAAPILVLFGDRFPMIRAHKVLAAYGCLAPRVITGQFDPTVHRAIWPSTGNYCRGGVAISRIMDCHGVAVLPEGMSRERFEWLERWVVDAADIIRTPGSESNVKEIYDKCNELDDDPANIIFNQFSEFGNHLVHYLCTGRAFEKVFHTLVATNSKLRAAAFISATGSAGTLGAGDYLKTRLGSRVVAAEALECPTLLLNGFGEHNIQGIGDKHIPLIHNVTNTDLVAAISERATDELNVMFNSEAGRRYLVDRRGVAADVVEQLPRLGFSSICNVLSAIKVARYYDLGENDLLMTVATDGAELYATELDMCLAESYPRGFDAVHAGEAFGEHVLGQGIDNLEELDHRGRQRIFNLGYYTWVEQQGISLEEFEARRDQSFWTGLHGLLGSWDDMIEEFNARSGAAKGA